MDALSPVNTLRTVASVAHSVPGGIGGGILEDIVVWELRDLDGGWRIETLNSRLLVCASSYQVEILLS